MSSLPFQGGIPISEVPESDSPAVLSPARSEVSNLDAESVSPKSSVGSEQSLTTQLLLGHRPNLFTKPSMSASSPNPSSSSSPDINVYDASLGVKSSHPSQPDAETAAQPVLLAAHHSPGSRATSPTSPTTLQQSSEVQHSSTSAPESNQHLGTGPESDSGLILSPGSDAEHLQQLNNPVDADEGTTSSNSPPSLLTIPPQLSNIKTLSPATSSQDNVVATEASHSLSGANAAQASALPDAPSIPQLLSMQSEGLASILLTSLAPEYIPHDNSSVTYTEAQLQTGNDTDAEQASPTTLQKTASSESNDAIVSEPTSPDAALDHPGSLVGTNMPPEANLSPVTEPSHRPASPSGTESSPTSPDFASATLAHQHQASSPATEIMCHADPSQQAGCTSPQSGLSSLQPNAAPRSVAQTAPTNEDTSPEASEAAGKGSHLAEVVSTASDSPHAERQASNAAASPSGRGNALSGTHGHAQGHNTETEGQLGVSHQWRQHRKHVFILSNAGKPIWTLHGDENALAGLMAVIQALVSFVHDKGDSMQSIRAGKHLIVFLEKGPFILVMASATNEPEGALLAQLGLVHGQILSILTNSVEKMFAKNPSYDVRKLLGATNHVLTSLVASFDCNPSAMFRCLVPLPLRSNLRHYALVFLQGAVKSAGALFGVLLTQKAIVAVAQSRAHVMHPHDLLLLANLVRSNESFRQAQTFTPLCLPHFNPTAFLHAYVQYLHVASGFCLVLLSPQPDSFFKLAEAAQEIDRQLKQPGVSQAIVSTVENQSGAGLLSIADVPGQCGGGPVGTAPLLHFLYKSPTRSQVVMPAFCAPLDTPELQQAAMQRYATVHAAVFHRTEHVASSRQASAGPTSSGHSSAAPSLQQQVHWCSDGSRATLAYAGPEYELYALFDAMTDKDSATQMCHRLSVWIKGQQADLFMPL